MQPTPPGGQVVVEDGCVTNRGEEVAGAGQLVPAVQRWGCLTFGVQLRVFLLGRLTNVLYGNKGKESTLTRTSKRRSHPGS